MRIKFDDGIRYYNNEPYFDKNPFCYESIQEENTWMLRDRLIHQDDIFDMEKLLKRRNAIENKRRRVFKIDAKTKSVNTYIVPNSDIDIVKHLLDTDKIRVHIIGQWGFAVTEQDPSRTKEAFILTEIIKRKRPGEKSVRIENRLALLGNAIAFTISKKGFGINKSTEDEFAKLLQFITVEEYLALDETTYIKAFKKKDQKN